MSKLIKKMQEKNDFSESEKMIADFLLNNFRELASLSTRQLAKLTYTSSAAIVRFSQKMGFDGYVDFKIQFMAEMMQYSSDPNKNESLHDKDSIKAIIEKVTHMEINAIRESFSLIDTAAVVLAISYISQAEHVDFYATDDNINIANMGVANLLMVGKTSTLLPSVNHQLLLSSSAPAGHISFIVSRTGENYLMCDIARIIKSRNGKIILLTGEKESTLSRLANVKILVSSTSSNKVEDLGPRVFTTGAKMVMDILFACMITKQGISSISERDTWLAAHLNY